MKAQATDAALLRRTITQNLSDDEHALFVLACERSGLDPFARQIYFLRQHGQFVIQATIDGLRISAERTTKYAGQLGPEWCGPDGIWKDIWTSPQAPIAARVGILRKDFAEPIWGKALFSEYRPAGDDFWDKMPSGQLAKCAEALGFRKAFPREFSGIYTPDEMAQSVSSDSIRVPSEPGRDSEHARGLTICQAPSVPLPVRSFIVNGTCGSRENVKAAFGFLQLELEKALGAEGTAAFRRIYARLPKVFRSREACSSATIACWVELWAAVETGRKRAAA